MSALTRSLLLRSYLLSTEEVPGVTWAGYWTTLSRFYLAHLATGGSPVSKEDPLIVDALLSRWEALR
jgi:hypothetical protein